MHCVRSLGRRKNNSLGSVCRTYHFGMFGLVLFVFMSIVSVVGSRQGDALRSAQQLFLRPLWLCVVRRTGLAVVLISLLS